MFVSARKDRGGGSTPGQSTSITKNKDASVVEGVPPVAPVTAGPARVELAEATSPKGWKKDELSARELNPANHLIDRVSTHPAATQGADIHQLLGSATDPALSDSIATALEGALKANSALVEVVLTASHAHLILAPALASPVRGVIVRALIAAVGATLVGTRQHATLIHGIDTLDLYEAERAQIERARWDFSPESIPDLKKQLPLPSWYQRSFGESNKAFRLRSAEIGAKLELICSLVEQGLPLDEVVSLVRYPSAVRSEILQGLRRHLTESSSSLSDRSQKELWGLLGSWDLGFSNEVVVEGILLAGTVSRELQEILAKRLLELKDTVQLSSIKDRWVVRMCGLLSQRSDCIEKLRDLFVAAKNTWQLGAILTGGDAFLAGEPCNPPSKPEGHYRFIKGCFVRCRSVIIGSRVVETALLDQGDLPKGTNTASWVANAGYRLATKRDWDTYLESLNNEEEEKIILNVESEILTWLFRGDARRWVNVKEGSVFLYNHHLYGSNNEREDQLLLLVRNST